MEIQEPHENHKKKIEQPVSVPFLWEEKPGTPKKDWNPNFHQLYQALTAPQPAPPVSAAIPFKWEEKPGTPLPYFSDQQPPPDPPLIPSSMITSSFRSYELYSQEIDKLWLEGDNDGDNEMYDSDGYETSDTFTSDSSVLRANSVAPPVMAVAPHSPLSKSESSTASSVLPANSVVPPVTEVGPHSLLSKSGSSTSSSASGSTRLVRAQFLKSLFPLLPPNSSIVWKEPASTPSKRNGNNYSDTESNCSCGFNRTSTLKELMMMSRRKRIHK